MSDAFYISLTWAVATTLWVAGALIVAYRKSVRVRKNLDVEVENEKEAEKMH